MGTYRDQSEKDMSSGEEKGLGIFGIIIGITRFTCELALASFSSQTAHCLHLSWQSSLPWCSVGRNTERAESEHDVPGECLRMGCIAVHSGLSPLNRRA